MRFRLNDYYDKAQLLLAIDNLPESPSGLTNTGGALNLAISDLYISSAGSRLYDLQTPQVLLLLTDGMANTGPQPALAAQDIQALGVTIISIGM